MQKEGVGEGVEGGRGERSGSEEGVEVEGGNGKGIRGREWERL